MNNYKNFDSDPVWLLATALSIALCLYFINLIKNNIKIQTFSIQCGYDRKWNKNIEIQNNK